MRIASQECLDCAANQEAKAEKRRNHLASFVPRFAELWTQVYEWADEQSGKSYDRASAQLVGLRAAYNQAEFKQEFAMFWVKYSRSVALTRRLKDAHLTP